MFETTKTQIIILNLLSKGLPFALSRVNKMISNNKNDEELFLYKSYILEGMRKYNDAIDSALKVLKLNPNSCWASWQLANLFAKKRNYKRARYYYKKAIKGFDNLKHKAKTKNDLQYILNYINEINYEIRKINKPKIKCPKKRQKEKRESKSIICKTNLLSKPVTRTPL